MIIGYEQTNKQTDRQAKYIYLYLSIGKIGLFSFPCFRTNLNDLESRNETRPGNAEGSFMFSKGWNSEDDMFATLSSPKMESATQTCISFKYSILVKHLSILIWFFIEKNGSGWFIVFFIKFFVRKVSALMSNCEFKKKFGTEITKLFS